MLTSEHGAKTGRRTVKRRAHWDLDKEGREEAAFFGGSSGSRRVTSMSGRRLKKGGQAFWGQY